MQSMGAIGGKTAVLPGFCKIECGGGGVIGVLSSLSARAAPVAPLSTIQAIKMMYKRQLFNLVSLFL